MNMIFRLPGCQCYRSGTQCLFDTRIRDRFFQYRIPNHIFRALTIFGLRIQYFFVSWLTSSSLPVKKEIIFYFLSFVATKKKCYESGSVCFRGLPDLHTDSLNRGTDSSICIHPDPYQNVIETSVEPVDPDPPDPHVFGPPGRIRIH